MNVAMAWSTLATVNGPATVFGFDIDFPSNDVVQVRLMRQRDNVWLVVSLVWAGPRYHAIPPFGMDWDAPGNRPLWEAPPLQEVVVPEGEIVVLEADKPCTGYIYYSPGDRVA